MPASDPIDQLGPTVAAWLQSRIAAHRLTQENAAQRAGLSRRTVAQLCCGFRVLTPAVALRLGRLFGAKAEDLMALQVRQQLEAAAQRCRRDLAAIKPLRPL